MACPFDNILLSFADSMTVQTSKPEKKAVPWSSKSCKAGKSSLRWEFNMRKTGLPQEADDVTGA